MRRREKQKVLVVGIQLMLVVVLVVGSRVTSGWVRIWYSSYFADVALPFGFYFLLMVVGQQWAVLKEWWKKALAVFGLCAISETLQYMGIFALARVFDPMDYVMYGVGVLLAVVVERKVLARWVSFGE